MFRIAFFLVLLVAKTGLAEMSCSGVTAGVSRSPAPRVPPSPLITAVADQALQARLRALRDEYGAEVFARMENALVEFAKRKQVPVETLNPVRELKRFRRVHQIISARSTLTPEQWEMVYGGILDILDRRLEGTGNLREALRRAAVPRQTMRQQILDENLLSQAWEPEP